MARDDNLERIVRLEQLLRQVAAPICEQNTQLRAQFWSHSVGARCDDLQRACPALDPTSLLELADHGEPYALDPSRLKLPWPVTAVPDGMDFLDFYARFPTAHGFLGVSPVGLSSDGGQAVVRMTHSLGLSRGWNDGFWPSRGDRTQPLPGNFQEYLVLEKAEKRWKLVAHLDAHASPSLRAPICPEELRERLQAELRPWAQIESVVIEDGTISQAQIRTARGAYQVLLVKSFCSRFTSREPAIVVFDQNLSGAAIRQGFDSAPRLTGGSTPGGVVVSNV